MQEGGPETPSSEYEPKELKELLKEMGMPQQASTPQKKIKFMPGPLNLMILVMCGAALTAAELRFKAASALDKAFCSSRLGEQTFYRGLITI